MVHQGMQHADHAPQRSHNEGGPKGQNCKKEGASDPVTGKLNVKEHEGHEFTVEERKTQNLEREEERISEAAAHRQIRALNMEAGLKPSKRAKKEARAAAKKLAKEQGTSYDGEHGESGDEDDQEEDDN